MAICANCNSEYSGSGPCPNCGFDLARQCENYPQALMPGTVLGGQYILGRVLGQGGFGITYVAQDYETKRLVAIKEYMPGAIAKRLDKTRMGVYSAQQQASFAYGKEKFLAEAKTLAQFNGRPNICDIYSYFEENGTAYYAMEYVEGLTLNKYMEQKGGTLSVKEALKLLVPVMYAMDDVHAKGIVHRDIAPDNIMVRTDGTVVLIDFGAARHAMGEESQSLTVMIKHGFAPKEQYTPRAKLRAYTDVYAMAATFYFAITGKVPPDAIDRSERDELIAPSKLGVDIPRKAEAVLLKGLAISYTKRYQNMGEFAVALFEAMADKKPKSAKTEPKKSEKPEFDKRKLVIAVCGAALVLLILLFGLPDKDKPEASAPTMPPASVEMELNTEPPSPGPEVGDISWSFDEATKTFTVSGSGAMENYSASYEPPWQGTGIPAKAERIVVEEGITHVGSRSFYVFYNAKELQLPESLGSIGYEAFSHCNALTEVELPDGVQEMDFGVFSSCNELARVKLSDGLETLPLDTFSLCKKLKYVDFGSGIRVIGDSAFSLCSALEEIHLPVELYWIGDMAFYKCSSLRYVDMYADVETVYDYAFAYCDSLEEVCFFGSQESWDSINIMKFNEPLLNAELVICDFNIG